MDHCTGVTLIGWGGVLNGDGSFYILLCTTITHYTVGDQMILLSAFWVTCLIFRTRTGSANRDGFAVAVFTTLG